MHFEDQLVVLLKVEVQDPVPVLDRHPGQLQAANLWEEIDHIALGLGVLFHRPDMGERRPTGNAQPQFIVFGTKAQHHLVLVLAKSLDQISSQDPLPDDLSDLQKIEVVYVHGGAKVGKLYPSIPSSKKEGAAKLTAPKWYSMTILNRIREKGSMHDGKFLFDVEPIPDLDIQKIDAIAQFGGIQPEIRFLELVGGKNQSAIDIIQVEAGNRKA